MLATPRVAHSPTHHLFANMRNFLGVPNTLNVLTCYPFLLVGILGLVLCLSGTCFGISLKGEQLGWALFYGGIAAAVFGSAYYHLKPDEDRVVWDKLPVMLAIVSLISNLVIERVDEQAGITCLFSLLTLVVVSIACVRFFNDLRLCMMFNFVPCIVIPALVFLFPPKYTHSRFWFLTAGKVAKIFSCCAKHFCLGRGPSGSLFHACIPTLTWLVASMSSFADQMDAEDSSHNLLSRRHLGMESFLLVFIGTSILLLLFYRLSVQT